MLCVCVCRSTSWCVTKALWDPSYQNWVKLQSRKKVMCLVWPHVLIRQNVPSAAHSATLPRACTSWISGQICFIWNIIMMMIIWVFLIFFFSATHLLAVSWHKNVTFIFPSADGMIVKANESLTTRNSLLVLWMIFFCMHQRILLSHLFCVLFGLMLHLLPLMGCCSGKTLTLKSSTQNCVFLFTFPKNVWPRLCWFKSESS